MKKKKARKEALENKNEIRIKGVDERLVLALIVLIGFLFRLIYFIHLRSNSPMYSILVHDSAVYRELALHTLQKGLVGEHAFYVSPFYIYFLAFIFKVLGDSINAVRVVQFAVGIGTALLTYVLAKKWFDRNVAGLAGILAAVYAPFLFFEGNLLNTSFATFLLAASITLLLSQKNNRLDYLISFFSGLLLSLAVTGRPNLVLLFPVPLLYWIKRKNIDKRALSCALLALSGFTIPLVLTSVHNYLAEKNPMPLSVHGGINFFIGNHEKATGLWTSPEGLEGDIRVVNLVGAREFAEKETGKKLTSSDVSGFWYRRAFSFIKQHPVRWIKLMGKKILLFWSSYEAPLNFNYYFNQKFSPLLRIPLTNLVFIMPLAIYGLIVILPQYRKYWLLYTILGLIGLSIVVFFMSDRYRIPAMPFLIILASAGIFHLISITRSTPGRFYYAGLIIILFIIQILIHMNAVRNVKFANDYYNLALAHFRDKNFKEAVRWGSRAVDENPENKNAIYNLGLAYLQLEDNDRAFQAFEKVVGLDSNEAGAHRNLARIYMTRGSLEPAAGHLEKAVRLEPGNVNGLMNLGVVCFYMKQYERAKQYWEMLLEVDPGNETARKNIQAVDDILASQE